VTRSKAGEPKPDVRRVLLEGELTISRARELKQALIEPLSGAGVLEVDLSQVTELDTAGVQLLLLAQRTAAVLNVELRFVAPSPAVSSVVALLGLGLTLGFNTPPPSIDGAGA
jgi:anti-sigma B factor antagonist